MKSKSIKEERLGEGMEEQQHTERQHAGIDGK